MLPPPAADPSPPSPEQHVPLSRKTWRTGTLTYTFGGLIALFLLLLLGDFAWSMRDRSVGQLSQWYLGKLSVPSFLFALLISSFPAALALILSPIISVRSDRHRGKWGRRIPYLLLTTPFAVFGMVGLGLTPIIAKAVHASFSPGRPIGEWLHRVLGDGSIATWLHAQTQNEMVISVICFGVFWASFELATIASQAVFGGLINDVVPHELLGRFYGLFRAVSLVDGMIFNEWIYGHVSTHYTLIFLVIATFYGLFFMSVCLVVKEGEYPPPAPPEDTPQTSLAIRFKDEVGRYFRECFSNKYYVTIFFLLLTMNLTFIPVNTFNMPFSLGLHVPEALYGHYLFLTYTTSLFLAPILGWLVDIFHPLRMVMAALVAYMVVTIWGGLFATTPDTFLIAFYAHGVVSGCFFTSAASLGNRLFPKSRFAQFSSAAGVLGSVAGIVFAPVMGKIIDLSGHMYRLTYFAGLGFSIIALILGLLVYRRFLQYGGPKNYIAPE
ncbi:hypothetical protein BH09VER1_BH09VER1_34380 [soil metagenome]